jgi:hypothetical protein
MRNGTPATRTERRGSSGIFIKASYDKETIFDSSEGATREIGGRESVFTFIPGEKPNEIVQPKFIESADEKLGWENKVRSVDEAFQRIVMGDETVVETIPGWPAERRIWEALKRARTGTQLRRAYSRSKIWLKSRQEFPGGGFHDWSWHPYPRALFVHADAFCKAKLDPRYPARDNRPSGDYRRIEYLGRVMAGLSIDGAISPSYSVEILRKMKHSQTCMCWRCRAKVAPRFSRSLREFLAEEFPE